jgi:hypothetical protein
MSASSNHQQSLSNACDGQNAGKVRCQEATSQKMLKMHLIEEAEFLGDDRVSKNSPVRVEHVEEQTRNAFKPRTTRSAPSKRSLRSMALTDRVENEQGQCRHGVRSPQRASAFDAEVRYEEGTC